MEIPKQNQRTLPGMSLRTVCICIHLFIYPSYFKSMGLNIDIVPVDTKDLPSSPRFTPYDFYRDASSALLQLVNQWLNFTYSRSHAFHYGIKNTCSGDKNRTHDFRTSRYAGYLLDHSGDESHIRTKSSRQQ